MTNTPPVHGTVRKRMIHLQITISLMLAALILSLAGAPAAAAGTRTKTANILPGSVPSDGLADPEEFEAFLDPMMADLMKANHIPGRAFAVVKDGQLFFRNAAVHFNLARPGSCGHRLAKTSKFST